MPQIVSRKKRDLVMFTTAIDPEVHKRAKMFAKAHGIGLNRVLETAVMEWLDVVEASEKQAKEKLEYIVNAMEDVLIDKNRIRADLEKTWQWRKEEK
jgi:hypothetical protein